VSYYFTNPFSGIWFEPPLASGFTYSLSSGNFTEVAPLPSFFGFGPVSVIVGGVDVGSIDPGDTFDFLAHGLDNVSTFSLEGISPELDVGSPNFPTSFPTFLDFTGQPGSLVMTPILAEAPEPASIFLLSTDLIGFRLLWRRRKQVS
jgi:hypothetical protein